MSWFKRGERRSPDVNRSRSDTDPNTCLEVFQNHWKQACAVILGHDKKLVSNGKATVDGVEAVLSNLEQMVTLLVGEDDDGGLPGPILNFMMESDLLETFCSWCQVNVPAHERLRLQELRLFELIISQSRQMLLIHKPIIKPLLRLLIDTANSPEISNGELEFKLVLVLHQICICISQQNLILESFFSTDADHGPARFLIFSLLIPYVYREGPVGQRARDALLLIMTLSARHPHIGQYIANNSDFCPVLATGLSGLYSSLPRKLSPPSDDWYAITPEDCRKIPDIQMFLNSMQFSNAVVQVAHPLVRDQLIEFIYSGFLMPVLNPALHQDISGLPIPLLDSELFRISREEVMTATAYLDLFIRHVTDPHLLKAVLRFVLTERYDDVLLLDSLLSRINSNTQLSTVTLALFNTLIDLNCEDVMFQLVFRYLVPCTHVMVSQRRSVRDLDLYGKSAEKFLSLRPACCLSASALNAPAPPQASIPSTHVVTANNTAQQPRQPVGTQTSNSPVVNAESANEPMKETSYFEYLHDARARLRQSARACQKWSFKYDGESPPPDSLKVEEVKDKEVEEKRKEEEKNPPTGFIEVGSILKKTELEDAPDTAKEKPEKSKTVCFDDSVFLSDEGSSDFSKTSVCKKDSKLYSSLGDVDSFLQYLAEVELDLEGLDFLSKHSIGDTLASLEKLFSSIHIGNQFEKSSSVRDGIEAPALGAKTDDFSDSIDVGTLSPISSNSTSEFTDFNLSESSKYGNLSKTESSRNKTAFEEISMSDVPREPAVAVRSNKPDPNSSSFVDISVVPEPATSPDFKPQPSIVARPERRVPKDFPKSFASSLPNVMSPSSSVFSPMKTHFTSVGDATPSSFKSFLFSADEFPVTPSSPGPKKQLRYLNDPPNIGPFMTALLSRLEGMPSNSLYFNLLLTDVLARLAAYPQPLLRSFLLNHNLVFQPSVKSLIQVLSGLRQKIDSYSVTVKQFDSLVKQGRDTLIQREEQLHQLMELGGGGGGAGGYGSLPNSLLTQQLSLGGHQPQQQALRLRADTLEPVLLREKKKVTLSDFFRRSPGKDKVVLGKNSKDAHLQKVQVGGGSGYRYVNSPPGPGDFSGSHGGAITAAMSTWNAAYSAIVLDEFLKELAALSQEHGLLNADEGYLSS